MRRPRRLIKAGAAIIDNMSILFAVGVAYGMSKDKDGAAALAGLVGYYVLTTLLSPAAVSQIQGIALAQVPKAFSKVNNQFVGILTGVIAAELYNRFSQVELHKALSFFSGRRLVPIVTSFVMIIVAFALMAIWPVIYNGLVSFGVSIKDMGPAGAGIYGFFNRLLIPVGLHHALNSVFWFDVAGINDIPNFLGGAKSLAEGKAVLGVTGMYQAGFFPIMMFGLPGAALAIYHTAKAENKARVASIMIAAGFASFFTGVTEPLEFSFMFVAPLLYVVHALLAGLSVYIAASMHWIAGFGFSAGLVDMVLSSRNPLAKDWYMLIGQGVVFFGIYYFGFRAAIRAFNLKTPGREDGEVEATETPATTVPGGTIELAHAYICRWRRRQCDECGCLHHPSAADRHDARPGQRRCRQEPGRERSDQAEQAKCADRCRPQSRADCRFAARSAGWHRSRQSRGGRTGSCRAGGSSRCQRNRPAGACQR